MKSKVLNAFTSVVATSTIFLLTACGGGGSTPSVDSSTKTSNAASNTDAYGAVKANFAITDFAAGTPTNASKAAFQGSSAMCSTAVPGTNMCLGGTSGYLGGVVPAVGAKCIYVTLGSAEMPIGFDILFHANDGRILHLASLSSSYVLMHVGQHIAMEYGDGVGLYQPDGKQWTVGTTDYAITVTSITHNQIALQFSNLAVNARTAYAAAGNISMNGSVTIDCDPSRDSPRY